jgi:probable rRNA maturation factor
MIGPGTMSGDPDPGGGTEATTMDDFVVISVTNEAWLETCSDVHQISKQAALAARARQTFLVGPDIGEITVVLSDDEAMRRLNRGFRGLDKPTNVLSFSALAPPAPGVTGPLGDVVLGFETVRRESIEFRRPLENHLQHLVVHGCLHLLGYDHEAQGDAEEMELLETEILAGLGISDPYAEEPSEFIPVDSGGTP